MKKTLIASILSTLFLTACVGNKQDNSAVLTDSGLNPQNFVTDINGKKTGLFVLKNKNNMEVCVTNFGGRIVSVMAPDRNGVMRDVVLGFDSIQDYIKYPSDYGASIGRYANRIANGRFTLDGTAYQLPQNNYGHCLHGGPKGFQYVVYDATQTDSSEVKLSYYAKDMEQGFPGNVNCTVTMRLTDDNAIDLKYEAETDKPTIINMTNHSYFNLNGDPSKPATDHLLYVASDSITPVDSTFMTTGEMMAVKDTPFDFNTAKAISEGVTDFSNEQVRFGNGFDHNWVLKTKGDINQVAAKLTSPTTGISLEVYTDEPGIQVYTGNFLDGTVKGKKGIVYPQRASVCLETQHYPDSPNKPQWPSVILTPGQTYHSHCIFKFTVEK